MPEKHDSSYRLLFSHRRMVEDLLRGFVHPGWTAGTVVSSAGSESRVGDRLERREQDVVWRLRSLDGSPDLYLLLEFQSEVDPQMSVRVTTYRGLLLQNLVRWEEVSRWNVSPPTLALVLYNGRDWWSDPSQAFLPARSAPEGSAGIWSPYLLVDALRDLLPEDPENLVSALFELERSRTPEAIDRTVGRLVETLSGPEGLELRRSFVTFLRESLLPARFPGAEIPAMLDLEEVRPMLRETVIEWTHQWKAEGRQEGRQQGEAALLVRLLERRFGPLKARDRKRVQSASSERLLEWGERFVEARSLAEVFGDS